MGGHGTPELRSLLVMGGIDMRQQARPRTVQCSVLEYLQVYVYRHDESPALAAGGYGRLSTCSSSQASPGSWFATES